jgi:hypothetical protein
MTSATIRNHQARRREIGATVFGSGLDFGRVDFKGEASGFIGILWE